MRPFLERLDAVHRGPVRELQGVLNPTLQARVRVEHLVHVGLITSQNYHESLVLGICHGSHEFGAGFAAVLAFAELVGFVDEQHATLGLVELLFDFSLRLANGFPREFEPSRLDHYVLRDQLQSK